ncbi:MAG TPA: DASS family sodium-coupled anion symporter [Gemmatimonadota bacterium]|nr:DASS family sodium-coupled anion symporter [Gemmatimonadota bacterium]
MTPADLPASFDLAGGRRGRIGAVLGPAAFAAMLLAGAPAGMEDAAWRTAATGTLMAIWWIAEPLPLPATALLPIVLFPLLGVETVEEAAAPFAHPIVFLFLGGFLLALGLERHGLHRRLALSLLSRTGSRPPGIVAGFLATAALLSMGLSNTATALLLLPIGISVFVLAGCSPHSDRDAAAGDLGPALLLAIAFGASIGGIGTLIGTPPNALTAAFLEQTYGIRIGFARWMAIGVPIVVVALPAAWVILTRVAFRLSREPLPGMEEMVARDRAALGPPSAAERRVAAVFAGAATLWLAGPLFARWIPGLADAGVAVAAGVALFLLPAGGPERGRLLDWAAAARLPWGVLLLFGGGLSLADAIQRTGLAEWLAGALGGLAGWPLPALLLVVALVVIGLSELASNTATAAAFLPVIGALAIGAGEDPALMVVAAGLAASGGFMLPVATPPNAIVYGSGGVTVPQLARAGGLLDVVFALLVPLAALFLVARVLG